MGVRCLVMDLCALLEIYGELTVFDCLYPNLYAPGAKMAAKEAVTPWIMEF